jgi:hypothetical protein
LCINFQLFFQLFEINIRDFLNLNNNINKYNSNFKIKYTYIYIIIYIIYRFILFSSKIRKKNSLYSLNPLRYLKSFEFGNKVKLLINSLKNNYLNLKKI